MCCVQYGMAKVLCEFDGNQIECRVIENMGFQGGDYVKAVDYKGEERIVVKRGAIWRPKTVSEKIKIAGKICGQ